MSQLSVGVGFVQKNKLFSLIDKAIFDYNLIEENDKILIGASGGKDSTALIEYFANRKKRPNEHFSFTALNIQTEISPPFPEKIISLFSDWNVDFKVISINVHERLKNAKKMNCYWCSMQRRTELNNYAMQNGFNKLALGHHADDVLETALMNCLNKGELATMIPLLKYDKYPVQIIRPLYYAQEKTIIDHAKKMGYFGFTCTCNFQENSERKIARQKIADLCDNDATRKQHLFNALKNVNLKYLP